MSASKYEERDWHEYLEADPELRQELEATLHSAPAQDTASLERLYARLLGTVPQAQASFQEQLRSDLIDPPQVFDDAPVLVKARVVAETPSAIANNNLQTSSGRRQRSPYFWPLTVAAILMLGLIGVEALLWLATKPPTYADVTPIAAVTVPPSPSSTSPRDTPANFAANLDLSYPGATQLKYNPYIPPSRGNFVNGALATIDDSRKIIDYYKQKLIAAGYTVTVTVPSCPAGANLCQASTLVAATSPDVNVNLAIYNSSVSSVRPIITVTPAARDVGPENLIPQLTPGQSLVVYNVFSYITVTVIAPKDLVTVLPANNPAITFAKFDVNIFHNDLAYPGATKIDYSSVIAPSPDSESPIILTTPDDYQKVIDYYRTKFKAAGYNLTENLMRRGPYCDDNNCKEILNFSLRKSDLEAYLTIWSAKSWDESGMTHSSVRYYTVKAGQTVLEYRVQKAQTPTPTALPISKVNLSYPGATQLNYDVQKFWLANRPASSQALTLGFFGSTDDYQKSSDFYENSFKAANYQVMTSTVTAGYNELTVYNGDMVFELIFLNSSARKSSLHSNFVSYDNIFSQLKPDQTFIAYLYGPSTAFKDLPLRSDYLPFPSAPDDGNGIFVGPDNTFHGTGLAGSGKERLVSTDAPRKFGVGEGKYFQVDWLISEDYHLSVGTTLAGPKDSQFFTITDKPATVKDGTGHTYQLKVVHRFDTTLADGQVAHHLIWGGGGSDVQLPSGTRQATFDPTQALLFNPSNPNALQVGLTLATFQTAKLPLTSTISFVPGRSALANGLKVSAPYAYFGPDRTLLAIHLESKDIRNSNAQTYTVAYASSQQPKADIIISFTDDKGQPVLPLPTAQPDPYYNPISMDGIGQEVILTLNPLPSGTKNLTLTVNSSTFHLTGDQLQVKLPVQQ